MTPQEFHDYQTSQLAELDRQMAVWGQRIQVLDQQISTAQQTLANSLTQLKGHLNNLTVAADDWLLNTDPSTSADLITKVSNMKIKINQLGQISIESDTTLIQSICDDLQSISTDLLQTATEQATLFSASLDQAASDLVTHYGIQI